MISTGSSLFDWAIVNEGLRLTLALLYYTAGFIACGFAIMVVTSGDRPERQNTNATIRANRTSRRRQTEHTDAAGRILCYAKSPKSKRKTER